MVQRKRNIKVAPRYRKQPDVKRLSRALLALVEADAERAAEAAHKADKPGKQAS